ncbi:MAG: protein kinase [Planctomycetes bacterium]|nr:protein kinase [Planctomycetota bacterium]
MLKAPLPPEVEAALKTSNRVFGRYALVQELGRGGMGTVYKAWQIDLRRFVALKVLHAGEDQDAVTRFFREAYTASRLGHPNIATVHEVGHHEGRYFIAMQYIDGLSLAQLLEHHPPRDKLLKVLHAAALVVQAAHRQGVVHRDLKPANIMLGKNGEVYLLDFGVARLLRGGDTLTASGMIVGTPAYMAPEQAAAEPEHVAPATDVWSLGVILYEILADVSPFRRKTYAETLMSLMNTQPPPPSAQRADVPPELDAVCLKALEKEAGRRYASAQAFADDLDRFLKGLDVRAERVTTWNRLKRRAVRHRTPLLVAGATLVLALGTWTLISRRLEHTRSEVRRQARALMDKGQWSNAMAKWEEIADDPEATEPIAFCREKLAAFGAEQEQVHRRRRATKLYQQADSALDEARRFLPQENRREQFLQHLKKAEQCARDAIEIDPDYPEAWYKLGQTLFERRDEECLGVLAEVIRLNPRFKPAYLLRARLNTIFCLDYLYRDSAPIELIDKLIAQIRSDEEAARTEVDPDEKLLMQALTDAAEGRADEAKERARRLYEKSGDREVLYLLALIHWGAREWSEARLHLEKLRLERPHDPMMWVRAGAALALTDETQREKGMAWMNRGTSMEPGNASLHLEKGLALTELGELSDALSAFARAAEIKPRTHMDFHLHYAAVRHHADTLARRNRLDEARPLYKTILAEGRPFLHETAYLTCYTRLDDPILMLDESTQVLRRLDPPDSPRKIEWTIGLRTHRGLAFLKLSQLQRAGEEFRIAVALGSVNPHTYYGLAVATGDVEQLARGLGLAHSPLAKADGEECRRYLETLRRKTPK